MRYSVILLLGLIVFFMSYDDASAVCCFPDDMVHHIDPTTGRLVVSGELWNDSYKVEPFGNAKYEFVFANSTGNTLFEKELLVTDGHPIHDGFVINPLGAHPLPFQMVIDDIDSEISDQVAHVGTGRTHVDYFSWKPADLNATLTEFKKIETIQGQTHGALFDKWQVRGTITNTHYDATQNVYVLASLYESEHRLVGVAGYSNEDIQPKTLRGHETKEFRIHALIPQEKFVKQVSLYAESDNSSMKYPNTKPIILKPDVPIKHGTKENSIPISVNVTNISRENIDFDWILQIKKSPKSLDEGDITKYPKSKVAFIDVVPVDVAAQESKRLEYLWTPMTGGIYFYEMYMWDNGLPVSLAFAGGFLYSNEILVTSNSLKEQLTSGIPIDEMQCNESLTLITKNNGFPACVTEQTKTKLMERGWAEPSGSIIKQRAEPEPEPKRNPVPEGNYVDKNTYVYSIHEAKSYLNYTLGTPYLPEGTDLEKIKISSDKRKATLYYSNGLEVKHNPMGINFNNTHYKLYPEQEEGKVFYDFRGTFAEGYEIDEPNRPHYSAITIHRDDRIYVRATMDIGLDELLKMIEPMDLNVPHVPYTPTLDYVMGAPEPEPIPEPEP